MAYLKNSAAAAAVLFSCYAGAADLRVPAFTAYLEPRPEALRMSSTGITGWKDTSTKILWFGGMKHAGALTCSVELRLPSAQQVKFRLSVGGQTADGTAKSSGTNVVSFGNFKVEAGHNRFCLELTEASEGSGVDVIALLLDGAAAEDAHFNLRERRNAASVHLSYDYERLTDVATFYCEVTAVEDPVWTFYMACGWHRGYFGMQVNSRTERRIIFSVWDSGNEAVSRNKVEAENRVTLIGKGEGVYTGDFGNEGTGGHSHLKYLWKTGEKQRFLVTAKPDDSTHTTYSGYYFHPDKNSWFLISSWRAPKEGGYLRGLHSFSENFGGANGNVLRKARYGNQWLRTSGGEWIEVTRAGFSHDPTGKSDRLDRFMGVEKGEFFLSHGGFVPGFTAFGEKFDRPALAKNPDFTGVKFE